MRPSFVGNAKEAVGGGSGICAKFVSCKFLRCVEDLFLLRWCLIGSIPIVFSVAFVIVSRIVSLSTHMCLCSVCLHIFIYTY